MINLNLTPWERVTLLAYLPNRTSYHEGLLIEGIEDDLKLTDEEHELLGVNYLQNGSFVQFDKKEKAISNEESFSFPKEKFRIIKDALKKADDNKNLIRDKKMFALYDKIMDAKEEPVPEEPE